LYFSIKTAGGSGGISASSWNPGRQSGSGTTP